MGFPGYIPDNPDKYEGKQIIINSDRILFNAKEDSVLLFAQKSIGLSTEGSLNFDTGTGEGSQMVVNTPKIYLGMNETQLPTEPAILGNKNEIWLNSLLDLIDNLISFLEAQYKLTDSTGGVTSPGLNDFSSIREGNSNFSIKNLRGSIEVIKSKRIKLT